ncbi:MAG: thioredoxin family protein [Saprospiraceae bacterium]|nr:thioredoxin family protein [Saprospiraceae bacterium]MDW8483614.1 thioredoxin family protein [Saprospiraceae bacterium]
MKLGFSQVCLMLFLFLAVSLQSQSGGGYRIGDVARDFKLKNVDGKMVSLASLKKAKGYVVIFTCNHCPFAVAYEDRIIALHKKYEKKGFPVVAINPNDKDIQPADSYENMQKRAKEKGFPFVYLYDETQEIARAYGATRTPHVFLLDKERRVRYIGAIDDNHEDPNGVKERYLENAIEALLAGKEVPRPETKAIGCTIKWRTASK